MSMSTERYLTGTEDLEAAGYEYRESGNLDESLRLLADLKDFPYDHFVFVEAGVDGWLWQVISGGERLSSGKQLALKDVPTALHGEPIPVVVDAFFRMLEVRIVCESKNWEFGRFFRRGTLLRFDFYRSGQGCDAVPAEVGPGVGVHAREPVEDGVAVDVQRGVRFERWESQSARAAAAVAGSSILEDLADEPLSLGERRQLVWLLNRATAQGQVVIREGGVCAVNAIKEARAETLRGEVVIELRG